MINGTHSMPQLLLPKLDDVKGSPLPVASPAPSTKEADKEVVDDKKAQVGNKEDAVDKTAKAETTDGEKKEVGCIWSVLCDDCELSFSVQLGVTVLSACYHSHQIVLCIK